MAGIYNADIFCDDCIDEIKRRIATELFNGNDDSGMTDLTKDDVFAACKPGDDLLEVSDYLDILDELDECYYDSDSYPKYCPDDAEADSPQHCGNCHVFLENDLTTDGNDYVVEAVNEDRINGIPENEEWAEFYDYLEFAEQCSECGDYSEDLEDDLCPVCYEDSKFEDEPHSDDFTITPTGPLGGKSGVGRVDGKFIGEFGSDDEAIVAIKQIMEDEQYWPSIWMVSDHGNWDLKIV